ncbi:MAG: hypothetical protein LM558_00245 [Thermosphaera sp.]|nr:hypothetical protein [Thermosphaera sp.]
MSEQKLLMDDPEGLPDFTLPVAIVAELIPSLAVDIAAQSIGNLKVDIAAQSLSALNVAITSSSVTLDVRITSSTATLNVNIAGQATTLNIAVISPVDASGNLKVAVQSSVTINVNIASQSITLNVNIASSSVTLNVNVTNSTLNVYVTGGSVTATISGTVNVNVTNSTLNVSIINSTVTLNTYIADFKATIAPTSLLEKGNQVVAWAAAYNGGVTFYTVPAGKIAYILTVTITGYNDSPSDYGYVHLAGYVYGSYRVIVALQLSPASHDSATFTGGILKLNQYDSLIFSAGTTCGGYVTVVLVEM